MNQPPSDSESKSRSDEKDPLLTLKYKGYCRALTPPGEKTTYEDFVHYAKFTLCQISNTLWKDPIWEEYTDEEILIEYFAHKFIKDEEFRKSFEVQIDIGASVYGEDVYEWLEQKTQELQQENEKRIGELPDKISFRPDSSENSGD